MITVIVLLLVAAGIIAVFAGLYVWTRISERDVDYKDLRDKSTQTDEQRRLEQLGIGLSSSQTMGGSMQ